MTLRNKAYGDNDLYDHAANSNSYSFLKNNHISCVIYRNDGIRTCCKTFLKTKSIQRFKLIICLIFVKYQNLDILQKCKKIIL